MTVADVVTAVAGIGIAGVGLLFAFSGVQHYLRGRRISGREPTPIGKVEPGPVSVSGTARAADEGMLTAPFSDRDCLAVRYEIREAQGKNRETPALIAEGVEQVAFTVEDESGALVVRPEGADLELELSEKFSVARDEAAPATVERFLSAEADVGEPADQIVDLPGTGRGTRYFREHRLEVGESVSVIGEASRRQGREFGDRVVEIRADGPASGDGTFVIADQSTAAVGGGRQSGGLMAVVIGGLGVVFGFALVRSTPFI